MSIFGYTRRVLKNLANACNYTARKLLAFAGYMLSACGLGAAGGLASLINLPPARDPETGIWNGLAAFCWVVASGLSFFVGLFANRWAAKMDSDARELNPGRAEFWANDNLAKLMGLAIKMVLYKASEGMANASDKATAKRLGTTALNDWPAILAHNGTTGRLVGLAEHDVLENCRNPNRVPVEYKVWQAAMLLLDGQNAANPAHARTLFKDPKALWHTYDVYAQWIAIALKQAYKAGYPPELRGAAAQHYYFMGEMLRLSGSQGFDIADLATFKHLGTEAGTKLATLVADLPAQEAARMAMQAGLDAIDEKLGVLSAPKLTLPKRVEYNERDRFVYRTERLKVVGRDNELKELNTWLDSSAGFGWDLWIGPAGSGKSRLALQLCRQREDWERGFFHWTSDNAPDWTNWVPTRNTLVIFDYVAEHAEVIGGAIAALAERATPTSKRPLPSGVKVRFLLLERAAVRDEDDSLSAVIVPSSNTPPQAKLEAPWLGVLRSAATATGAPVEAAFEQKDMQHPGRYISGVPLEAVFEIIAEEASLAQAPLAPERHIERLFAVLQIDPHMRPLFVAMAAEGHREHEGFVDFDQLVAHINRKEWTHARKRLQEHPNGPGATPERWMALTCLATMCQGLTDDILTDALVRPGGLELPTPGEWGDGSRYDLLVSGASPLHAPQLEPDILGEACVLDWLRNHPMEASVLIARAWELGMADFVARAAQNFPSATAASGLLKPGGRAQASPLAAAHNALAVVDLQQGKRAAVATRGRELAEDRLQPAAVRALGMFLWMHDTSDAATIDAFTANLKTFDALTLADAAVREQLANGLYNAFNNAGADSARSDPLLDKLRTLARDHPDDAAVRGPFSKGLFNAFNNAVADTIRRAPLLDELRTLVRDHPDDAVVRKSLASGLFNALGDEGTDADQNNRLLDELRTLARDHPDDAEVRGPLTKGLFNAFIDAGTDTAWRNQLLDELRTLARDHPDDAEVRWQLAKSLTNELVKHAADTARSDALLDELRTLARDHPDDAAMRSPFSTGLVKAINNAGADAIRSDPLLDELRTLTRDHPADTAMRERLARGLASAISHAGSETARSDGLLLELRTLARDHPTEQVVFAAAFRGCAAVLVRSFEHGRVEISALANAVELVPGLSRDLPEAKLVMALIGLVAQVAEQVEGEHKSLLEKHGAALWVAYQAHFDGA